MLGVARCRDIRGRTKHTCVQLRIPSTLRYFWFLVFACNQVLVLLVFECGFHFEFGSFQSVRLIDLYGIYTYIGRPGKIVQNYFD